MTPEVLVIGGGMAGFAAALAARAAGAATVLVRAGPGATALSAGTWTGAPPAPVRQALAAAGLELVECNAGLPHPDGRLVHADFAAASHAAASLRRADRVTLVCGIHGSPWYRPVALAALWRDAAGLPDGNMQATMLDLPGTPAAGWSPASLAAQIERAPERLASLIVEAARGHDAAQIILPAVLGLAAHAATFTALSDAVAAATGAAVGEALGVAPSLPGWRLDRAMLHALEHAAVPVIGGRVAAHGARDRALHFVTVTGQAGPVTITPAVAVLASGRFIGGGITADTAFAETVFGTDIGLHRFGRTFTHARAVLALTDPVRLEPQPILHLGVATDEASRLISLTGDVVFSNVLAAGSVCATADDVPGLGRTAADGWSVGARAAALAAGA
jgi:anaerobic glycerol-3-phosphate dehydrogenase